MRILISGVCGFVGSALARELAARGHAVSGFDNFIRPGSEANREALKKAGVKIFHADVRAASDLETVAPADWVIDAAANPSVLAGVDGQTSSRQLVEHNLGGTINLLEFCKTHRAGLVLLSTSRVYSIAPLAALAVEERRGAFRPSETAELPPGLSAAGVRESFSTQAPVSLYGATKLASEALALEYGETFGLPVFVNRCGVLAGAGQFGRADQGIFAYWVNMWLRKRPLKYIGFGGHGHQVRDCLHPRDLVPALERQFTTPKLDAADRVANFSGGAAAAMSLRQLSEWCAGKFGAQTVTADARPRPFDLPWLVLDSAKADRLWDWRPATPLATILDEIAAHADKHPAWLDLSAPLQIMSAASSPAPLTLYSVVIPARDEEASLPPTLRALYAEFLREEIPHEIVVVDDGSHDATWKVLQKLREEVPTLAPVQNPGPHGFGRAIVHGFGHVRGDAVVVMMADASDSPADAVRYWRLLGEGFECAFGSRFVKGGRVVDYPRVKLFVNRLANLFIRVMFRHGLNDTTNAFKAYRRHVIEGCRPLLAPHFNLTVELPLKAIVRGYTWTVTPISWENRKHGVAKLKIKEMGSRYFFICMYVWLEKYFSRGDYRRK